LLTPTNEEYILMAEKTTSWDKVYSLGSKLGLAKLRVDNIIKTGKPTFDTNVASIFPNWKTLLTNKAWDLTFDLTPTPKQPTMKIIF